MASPQQEWRWAVEGLREVASYAGEKGIRPGIEPLNRFETYFINRHDQALLLAQEVGLNTGVVLDTFYLNIEESDPVAAIRATSSYLVDVHVADNNRYPPGQGAVNWSAVIGALRDVGYDGYLISEFVMPIDRTPVARPEQEIDVPHATEMTVGWQRFLSDHASGPFSERYYELLARQAADFLRGLL